MGIEGLGTYINKQYPQAKCKASLMQLSGRTIAIDTVYFMYTRYKASLANTTKKSPINDVSILKSLKNVESIINALLDVDRARMYWFELCNKFIISILSINTVLLWVLDGDTTVHKNKEKATCQAARDT
jgi:hypothetical protein